jgi:hypothetical protein
MICYSLTFGITVSTLKFDHGQFYLQEAYFRSIKYTSYLNKIIVNILVFKMTVLRPGIFYKMSRIHELQPWKSFFLTWTGLESEYNTEMNQLHC